MANAANGATTEWPLHVVRFEDIVTETESTVSGLFSNLGLPLPVKALNRVLRVATTGRYVVAYDGTMSPDAAGSWKRGIDEHDVTKIERICGGMMAVFGYEMGA